MTDDAKRIGRKNDKPWRLCGRLDGGAVIVYQKHPSPEKVPWREAAAWTAPFEEHKRARAGAKELLLYAVERLLEREPHRNCERTGE
jgi:hypothetical protein